jgi:sec-independent protein translocase protein TatC
MIDKTINNENSFLFKFRASIQNKNLKLELPFRIHFEELRQRGLHLVFILALFSILAFIEIKPIVQVLEIPVASVKFFQLSPGEYFIETLKIALYSGIILTGPILITQICFFINPGLTSDEKKLILPLLAISTLLIFLSIGFSYFYLIPAAVKFFILYSSEVLEPLWSFTQYFDFVLVLFFTTAIAFQIPILQIILGILGIVSGNQMLKLWKYVILIAVILSAVLTPSTDPITQLLLSSAIIALYFVGTGILIILKR